MGTVGGSELATIMSELAAVYRDNGRRVAAAVARLDAELDGVRSPSPTPSAPRRRGRHAAVGPAPADRAVSGAPRLPPVSSRASAPVVPPLGAPETGRRAATPTAPSHDVATGSDRVAAAVPGTVVEQAPATAPADRPAESAHVSWTHGVLPPDHDPGRSLPAWLHQTEDVWGEATIVTAPVIGDLPPRTSLRSKRPS